MQADTAAEHRARLTWDVFCRVVDNHGDLGVCWRLARRLAALGQTVRLWIDDDSALAWMAPSTADTDPGVQLMPWRALLGTEQPGDVVVETFGCDLPAGWLERMAAATLTPVWIDLEYLSAEPYVERSHGLPSPQTQGPGAGLTRWFYYPGFTADTGGLLLEDGFDEARQRFDARAWRDALALSDDRGAATVSLFCYDQPTLPAWLAHWRARATRLLVTPGPAATQVAAALACSAEPGKTVRRDALTAHFLPWLPQTAFDSLLWACELNHVRGEDSLVRALWSGRPFVWQIYPQHDGAHLRKLQAFLDMYLDGATPALAAAIRLRFFAWNGAGASPAEHAAADLADWAAHARSKTEALRALAAARGDLGLQLYRFALSKR